MSSLLETLKIAGDPKPTVHEMTQEQLAEVYFSGSEKVKKSEYPLVIKVIDRPKPVAILPWVITSVAILIMALSVFSTKRLLIDIKVIDQDTLYTEDSAPMLRIFSKSAKTLSSNNAPSKALSGYKIPFQNFIFEGAAGLKSTKNQNGLKLVNSSVAPFARAVLGFEKPVDLTYSRVIFYAKGARGGENIAVALKDGNNIGAFRKGKYYPFPDGLTTSWQQGEVPLTDAHAQFNKQRIASLRFEFGSKDTENRPGDSVLIKDLQIVPISEELQK